jgi:hypothetical protein
MVQKALVAFGGSKIPSGNGKIIAKRRVYNCKTIVFAMLHAIHASLCSLTRTCLFKYATIHDLHSTLSVHPPSSDPSLSRPRLVFFGSSTLYMSLSQCSSCFVIGGLVLQGLVCQRLSPFRRSDVGSGGQILSLVRSCFQISINSSYLVVWP